MSEGNPIDVNKVVQHLAEQITPLHIQIALLRTKVEELEQKLKEKEGK